MSESPGRLRCHRSVTHPHCGESEAANSRKVGSTFLCQNLTHGNCDTHPPPQHLAWVLATSRLVSNLLPWRHPTHWGGSHGNSSKGKWSVKAACKLPMNVSSGERRRTSTRVHTLKHKAAQSRWAIFLLHDGVTALEAGEWSSWLQHLADLHPRVLEQLSLNFFF